MVIDRTTKDSVYGVIVFFAQAEDYVLRRVTVDYREEFPPDAIHVSARFAAKVTAWPAHPLWTHKKGGCMRCTLPGSHLTYIVTWRRACV